jgi:16S rRNA (cytidine1402-2'-O)-methyltransferase
MDQTIFLDQQNMPKSSLYMVSTPIGNLGDITYRGVHILRSVDGIACEDTRHTSHLLQSLGIHKPLMAIHEHNENSAAISLINRLQMGERWAYVCDAGTPSISDPGARLVHEVRLAGYQILPIPGPSAITALLSVAGQLTHSQRGEFQFLGFLPLKGKGRSDVFDLINKSIQATVFYESPQRIKNTLNDILQNLNDHTRSIVIGRELTKKFETISYLTLSDLPLWLSSHLEERGEFCIILGGAHSDPNRHGLVTSDCIVNLPKLAEVLSSYLGSKQIAEVFSKAQLMSKNDAYDLALKTKNPSNDG